MRHGQEHLHVRENCISRLYIPLEVIIALQLCGELNTFIPVENPRSEWFTQVLAFNYTIFHLKSAWFSV